MFHRFSSVRHWVATVLLCLMCFTTVNVCWAGDRMNIDFLNREAVRNDPKLKEWTAEMVEEQYGSASGVDKAILGLDIVTDALWGASMVVNNFKTNLVTGLLASGTGATSYAMSAVRDKKSNKRMRALIDQIKKCSAQIETDVQNLYTKLKEGSLEAREKLVKMTNEQDVEEVESNIAMESYFRSKQDHAEPSQPDINKL